MNTLAPSDFTSHDDWLDHVRQVVASEDQPFALALGRLELYRGFYRVRHETLPVAFEEDFKRIEALVEPERTTQLECMNDWIFAQLIETLRGEMRKSGGHDEQLPPQSARERTEEIIAYLTEKNLYFRIWVAFKDSSRSILDVAEWQEYVSRILPSADEYEREFALSMSELGQLLGHFRNTGQPLPLHFSRRVWFLHHLRGAERTAHTRALLRLLTEEIQRCGCA